MDLEKKQELNKLIYLVLEGEADSREVAALDCLMESSPEAVRYCMRYYSMTAALRKSKVIPAMSVRIEDEENAQLNALKLLAEDEVRAPGVDVPQSHMPVRTIIEKVQVEKSPRKTSLFSLSVAALSTAALFSLLTYVHFVPVCESVATVTDSMEVRMANSSRKLQKGQLLFNTDKPFHMESGLLGLQFEYGAKVVLQAPCTFVCKSDGSLYLSRGKVFASVSRESVGFTVETPISRIIDLGTEFGVEVDSIGSVSVQVYKGKTQLVSNKKNRCVSELLEDRDSKRIDKAGKVTDVAFHETAYIRSFNSETSVAWRGEPVSLADLIGKGNGFGTGSLGSEIDVSTGRFNSLTASIYGKKTGFASVPDSPFVDGYFVPNPKLGPIQVSSEGHFYNNCPPTTGRYTGNISNGGYIEKGSSSVRYWQLNGVLYGTPGNPAIYLHSNKGITFDLQAIRRSISPADVNRFTALCGLSQTASQASQLGDRLPTADMMVLIDGQERFRHNDIEIKDGAVAIDITIEPSARFLTLLSTNGSDNLTQWDWCLFAEPYLHLEAQ